MEPSEARSHHRRRLAVLQTLLQRLTAPRPSRESPSQGATAARPEERTLSDTIKTGLSLILETEHVHAVVAASSQGFPVACVGDTTHVNEIAALAGSIQRLAAQATDLLPVSEILKVSLTDRNTLTLSCRMFRVGEELLTLATLSTGKPPEEAVMSRAFQTISSAIRES